MKKMPILEWLVVVYDRPGTNRLLYRGQHLTRVPQLVRLGIVTNLGPVFADPEKTKFVGSSFNVLANTRQDVVDFLKEDIYYKEGVWDVDNAIIHPYTPVSRAAKVLD